MFLHIRTDQFLPIGDLSFLVVSFLILMRRLIRIVLHSWMREYFLILDAFDKSIGIKFAVLMKRGLVHHWKYVVLILLYLLLLQVCVVWLFVFGL
ncbi:hypothetical protein VE06_11085 [Salmonella enterica subsp. enterica serovar Indiana]|nr:hypothetical protein ACH55_07185 [Salmonella enterica subsp. enterica serovar Typhimurium]OXY76015.1 hypothetical protein P727_12695 [Salmonella enterica subsp. enterica serovar Enteritidis str. SHSE001]PNW35676.1 hypothetical protein VE06_11085 [Salmonella enterica subsp. enterica serovar Indiana]